MARPSPAHRAAPAQKAAEDHVNRMGPRVDEKVDLLGTVMDRVKIPQEWDLVAQAVSPVVAHVTGHQPGEHAGPAPAAPRSRPAGFRDGLVHGPGDQADGTLSSSAGSRLLRK